jgi:hypothetical protein
MGNQDSVRWCCATVHVGTAALGCPAEQSFVTPAGNDPTRGSCAEGIAIRAPEERHVAVTAHWIVKCLKSLVPAVSVLHCRNPFICGRLSPRGSGVGARLRQQMAPACVALFLFMSARSICQPQAHSILCRGGYGTFGATLSHDVAVHVGCTGTRAVEAWGLHSQP